MFKILRACAAAVLIATPAFADSVTLRPRVEAHGAAITLGDVFDGAGAEASRPIAPAPSAGQTASLSAEFLTAAVQSAGHTWTAPANISQVQVTRPAGARATIAARATLPAQSSTGQTANAVRRNETILLTYEAPGIRLSARARALEDGGVGQTIRLVNLQSNRTLQAVVTGPGAAEIQ